MNFKRGESQSTICPHVLQLHAVEESLVDAICHAASEGRRVVVFLELPDGDWIHGRGKRAINSACPGSQRLAVVRDMGDASDE
jgi:hypothetical protein